MQYRRTLYYPNYFMNYFKIILFSLLGVCFLKSQEVPEDLIGDEHVREEFGVNRFTTPSIKKLFDISTTGMLTRAVCSLAKLCLIHEFKTKSIR